MTRHARNSTAGSVYTYHERKRDKTDGNYGKREVRVGKDSVKEFDCCSLTLQPCKDPVVTPDGHLYDKEAILEYILHQKKGIARKLKEFEKQKEKLNTEQTELKQAEEESKRAAFIARESAIKSKVITSPAHKNTDPQEGTSKDSVNNMANGKDKQLPSFWLPSLTPQSKPTLIKKPDEKVKCPMSGKPIKLKDLTSVKFTEIKDGSKKSLITKDARYVCAVTNDVLGNSVPCAVLKTSGSVVTMECVEKIIKKDMNDPINGKPLTEKDIIPLQRGATGFAGAGVLLESITAGPSLQG